MRTQRWTKIWGLVTACIGLAVIVLTYINEAMLGDYFDQHEIFDDRGLSIIPSLLLGICGLGLTVGGLMAAVGTRDGPSTKNL